MKDKTLSPLITGYESTSANREPSFFCRTVSGKVRKKRGIAIPASRLFDALAYTTFRSYGTSVLIFGLATILVQFAKTSLQISTDGVYPTLIVGAVAALFGALLLVFDKPLCTGLQEWVVTDYVFYDFLRIKRAYAKDNRGIGIFPMILVGILLASITYFVPAQYVAATLGALIYVVLSLFSPEFSLFTTLLILPITPLFEADKIILCALVVICSLSFWIKVATGKRFYRFEQYDLVLLIMLFFMLISGIFLGGVKSFTNSLGSLTVAAVYFVASNIITNRRLYECALMAISVSSVPISVMCIVEFIRSATVYEIPFPNFNISATFSSAETLAAFLTVAIICTYLLFKYYEKQPTGILFASLLLLDAVVLMLALRLDAILAIFITAIIIGLASKNKKMLVLTIVVYLSLHLVYLIPESAMLAIAGKMGRFDDIVTERVASLSAAIELLSKHPILGVGIGNEPFADAILELCDVAHESSHSLILQMACEGGIFVPLCFLLLMLIRVVHVYKYLPYVHKSITSASLTMSGLLFALLVLGLFNNIFYDPAIFCLFFTMFGIGSAMLRASKTEHDEKLGYFTDTLSLYSSSLDVDVE